ncbi:branched-chain amino acid ABC transporter permease [Roseiflexus sp.]|uniref:branched-chain amino acid ABC transporter permease n=1 Tax=Roseiflexus sp. TaxID=2562120 RepID=UPI0021DC7D6E|nr:branched-chain amino acid ABC transporter permease [Roseiflexus sp.]GIV99184.1 MAG: branched-chain amino acid ABC transporter permease [Roseiflexus sp.]
MQSGTFHTSYAGDMALRPYWVQRLRIVLVLIAVLTFPWVADRYWLNLANTIAIAAIGAIGLNILVGYTGQISIGHGGFLAVGAYTAGLLAARLDAPMWVTIPVASGFTALVGAFFGLPSVRLKGLYLAIATLAAQEIIIWLLTHGKLLGIGESLTLPQAANNLFGFPLSALGNNDFAFYWVTVGFLILTVVFVSNLFRSRTGRAFVAIRDQDIAAQVIGVDLFRYKLLAFATSSFFAGLAGALTAHYRGIISWERFTIDTSILYLAMIIIGGLGSVSGSIYGAAFMTLLPALLSNLARAISGVVPDINTYLPYIQQGAFGLAIVLFLIFEPEGIVKMWRNVKDYFRLWPFSY